MRGLWLEDGRLHYREDLRAPESKDGSSRVRVITAGICATDLALQRGYMQFRGIPGHEFVGKAIDGPLAGQRVVGEINAACGNCGWCRDGMQRHCPQRTVLGILEHGGAFAEELCLPDENLHPIPDHITSEVATFTEPLAAAFELTEQIDLEPGTRALVAGDGKLGCLCAWVLSLHGLDVTVAGRHLERKEILPPDCTLLTGLLEEIPPADTATYQLVVEATGHAHVLPRLLKLLEPRGIAILKTTTEETTTLDLAPLVVDEITLLGSRCGPFEPAIQALADDVIPVAQMIAGCRPLAEANAAFDEARQSGNLKVLLDLRAG
ncbi:MAG: alcohol dehydrogenase catalytic domain-containing protein [Planctomycetota bacterium]|jgi:threonine dehydrogenase-like Zn-dependent dehydrogenase|nr:alcohol dehydrogenase catalytic domain-containing protein [Planctomycetota bacterium]